MTSFVGADLASPGSDWEAIDKRMVEIVAERPGMARPCVRAALVNRAMHDVMIPKMIEFRKRLAEKNRQLDIERYGEFK